MRLLTRGLEPRKRWNGNREVEECTIGQSGVTKECAILFQNESTLRATIETGLMSGVLTLTGPLDRMDTVVRARAGQSPADASLRLLFDATRFVCHIFPLEEALERG